MFIKSIISLVFAPLVFISQFFNSKPELIYTAPEIEKTVIEEVIDDKKSVVIEEVKNQNVLVKTTEIATTTKKVIQNKVKEETPKDPVVTAESEQPADFAKINTEARKTTINIFCTTKYGDLSPISGTGVVINENGLILTNAHIAQYFLLKDYREKDYLKCVGRTGSPAYPKYNLELVYISPDWVAENKGILKKQNPTGTGENDYAFLRVTNMIDGSDTSKFIYISPNTRELINVSEPVLLASYPAGFLGGISIIQDLNITSAVTNIQDIYTFKDGTIDIISVGGTVVSQKGSSGGLVVDKNTSLIGIITTSSDGNTTSSRGLNAITLSYINRSLQREISMDMRNFLELDHKNFAESFKNNLGKDLSKLIIDELNK
jgi:hypothetical protein